MNILITGAAGFVGKNLTTALKNIRDNKDRTRPALSIGEIYEYDVATDPTLLYVRLTVMSNNQANSSTVSKGRFPRFR